MLEGRVREMLHAQRVMARRFMNLKVWSSPEKRPPHRVA